MTVNDNPAPTPISPAVTAATTADTIAEQLRAVLVTLQAIVPFLLKYDLHEIKRIAASAKFGNVAIVPAIDMVTAVPRVKQNNMFDVDAGHFAREYQDQVVPLAKRLIAFGNDLLFTGDKLLADSAIQALQLYRWAQHVVKQPGGADLQPFVDDLSRLIKKTQNHRKPAASTPPPTSHTPSTPGGQGFLASNVSDKTGEPDDVADLFDRLLLEAAE